MPGLEEWCAWLTDQRAEEVEVHDLEGGEPHRRHHDSGHRFERSSLGG